MFISSDISKVKTDLLKREYLENNAEYE